MSDIDPLSVLADIPAEGEWQVVARLTNGPISDKWQVSCGERLYSLRIDRPVATRMGLNRYAELQAIEQLAPAGWCGEPAYSDTDSGILILPWVEGRAWSGKDFADAEQLQRLGRRLGELHSSGVQLPPLQLADRVRHYADVVGSPAAMRRANRVRELLVEAGTDESALCACHNDAGLGNVIEAPELMFIDFEYAAAGDPRYELAAVIRHQRLPEAAIKPFLQGWSGPGAPVTSESLRIWCLIYDETASLWSEALRFST